MYLSKKKKELLVELAEDLWNGNISAGAGGSVLLNIIKPHKWTRKEKKQAKKWAEEELKKIRCV